jgi:hypothetical protein
MGWVRGDFLPPRGVVHDNCGRRGDSSGHVLVKVTIQLLMLDALRKGALGGTLCRCGGPEGTLLALTQLRWVIVRDTRH